MDQALRRILLQRKNVPVPLNRAYIALGSNIEPRKHYITSAIKKIKNNKNIVVKKLSSIYDTYPIGCMPEREGRFLNSVIEIETSLRPHNLLDELRKIEKSLGRARPSKAFGRTIDLDLLLYGNAEINDKKLVVPHPRMHERDFVMLGMEEIAPKTLHPVLKKSISQIYNKRAMKVIKNPKEAYKRVIALKKNGKRIGFIPTMGCLHEGHLGLIRRARRENDVVVVSIFVNPTQFGPREDYRKYPRDFSRDRKLAKASGADIIFYPGVKDMYSLNHSTYVEVEKLSANLCGRFRPRHFRGVATVVAKLFNIIPADNAYFGQKDAQQAFVIKRLARDLDIPVNIRILPTAREKDGLAMSSRNTYLNEAERREAGVLYRSLLLAKDLTGKGEKKARAIIEKMKELIKRESSGKIQYIQIVDTRNFEDAEHLKGEILIALAVYFGRTRLIDNIILKVSRASQKRRPGLRRLIK